MKSFFVKLLSPRPSFPSDATKEEMNVMARHVQYWTNVLRTGKAVAFGPVADPSGTYGIAIIEAEDDSSAKVLVSEDPVLLADIGFKAELLQMPRLIARPFVQLQPTER
jgi:uncharacterized protein YciI